LRANVRSLRGLGLLVLLCSALPAEAQEAGAATSQPLASQPAGLQEAVPGPVEITARHRMVADSASLALREITTLAEIGALRTELEVASRRQRELQQFLDALSDAEYLRLERLARVRDRAIQQDQRLEALGNRAGSRLDELGRIRGEWLQRHNLWREWQQTLRLDADFAIFEPEIQQSLVRIEEVLERVGEVLRVVVPVQRDIEGLRRENEQILASVQALRLGRRAALLRQTEPVLFSGPFREQLAAEPWGDWQPFEWAHPAAYGAFVRENSLLLLTHLLLALALAWGTLRVRRVVPREGAWSVALAHPWAFGIFSSTALVAQRYTLSPPLWEVVTWTLLAGSAALLATRLFELRSLRVMVYFFAAFYPLFLLGEAVRLPEPLFRIALAAGTLIGAIGFATLARRNTVRHADDNRASIPLWLATLLAAVILLAEVLGFYLLTRWIVHASVTTALVIFTAGLLLVLARGAMQALVRHEGTHRRFIRNVGLTLAERVLVLFQIVLVVAAVLVVLDVWELVVSPLETWRLLTGFGFAVGGVQITVGRLLWAVVLVYLAVLASWIVRTFVNTEVTPRWSLERGVGDSINTLLHYTLLTIGVLLGLGTLGVHLQNFAIVAGALGIGIGFGLQNIVNNFVSGLILLFERPVRVGDTVVIGGEWGTIKKIGLRSTVMVTFDQSELIVPNADLVAEKVTNWTLSNPIARLVMPVGAAYGSDVQRVLEILREAGPSHAAVLPEPPPQAVFIRFGDNSLDFELRVWVQELRQRMEVQSVVLAAIDRRFREEGIEIPFPQRDLHLRSIDPQLMEKVLGGRGNTG
jgi:potassium-dependent mechanosensitive channel